MDLDLKDLNNLSKTYEREEYLEKVKKFRYYSPNYAYILSSEFTQWFNNLFKILPYDFKTYSYEDKNIYEHTVILYRVLLGYMKMVKNREEDLTYDLKVLIKHNDKIYEVHILNPFIYFPSKKIGGDIKIFERYKEKEYDLTLESLQNYVLSLIDNNKKRPLREISTTVDELIKEGYKREDILQALQINYANISSEYSKSR